MSSLKERKDAHTMESYRKVCRMVADAAGSVFLAAISVFIVACLIG